MIKKHLLALREEVKKIKDESQCFMSIVEIESENSNYKIPSLTFTAFEAIVLECKQEYAEADEEHIKGIFNMLYMLDLENTKENELFYKIENFFNTYLNTSEDIEVPNEKIILKMAEILDYSSKIEHFIVSEMKKELILQKNIFSFLKKTDYEELKTYAIALDEINIKLGKKLEQDSMIISKKIIDDFYNIYIFLIFITKYGIITKNTMLLIEISHIIDRLIEAISFSFKRNSMKNIYLLYHYVDFELREIQNMITNELNGY